MEKRYHRGYFFLLRQKCFRGQPLPPEGRLYARAKRGLGIETQGGKVVAIFLTILEENSLKIEEKSPLFC